MQSQNIELIQQISDVVSALLAAKLEELSAPTATRKFVTPDTGMIYITYSPGAEGADPKAIIKIVQRVVGGLQDTTYRLYADSRFYVDNQVKLFGGTDKADTAIKPVPADDKTTQWVLDLITSLYNS
jgi:hypothetical protein